MFTHEMIKSFNQLEMDVYNYIISNEEKVVYMKSTRAGRGGSCFNNDDTSLL